MTILEQICDKKREHVKLMKGQKSEQSLIDAIDKSLPRFNFEKALQNCKDANIHAIIAEIKKASPSKGIIRADFNPVEIAKNYEQAGTTCISCLTDEPYFQGRDEYLKQVKSTIHTPVLRKDFMVDLYQIYESRALGADAILIIMAALDDKLAYDMFQLATELGMSALFEVHDSQELDRALQLSPKIVGVNNRNLKTLDVSLSTSYTLINDMPDDVIKISESGISTYGEINDLKSKGFDGFLIGESLMNKQDESGTLSDFLK